MLEGSVTGITERGEVLISQSLRAECDRLDNEAQARALKLAPMHVANWEEAQREGVLLAACHKWLSKKKSIIPQKRDALLKECRGNIRPLRRQSPISCEKQFNPEERVDVREHHTQR